MPPTASPDDVDGFDFPDHWTPAARDAFEVVMDARPALGGAEFAALTEAANLITTADALDAVARAAAYMSTGAAGQPVLHPAVSAATTARTAAATVLARLTVSAGPATTTPAASRATRAATARWGRAK